LALNVVGGCEIVDPSCYFCYAAPDAAGIQTANDIQLYLNTTEFKHERWTWNGNLTELPPDHSTWNDLLSFGGVDEPLLGKGKPCCCG
jgi:protein gp37